MAIGKIARIKLNEKEIPEVYYGFKKEEISLGQYTGLAYAKIVFTGRCNMLYNQDEEFPDTVYTYFFGEPMVRDDGDMFKTLLLHNLRELYEHEEETYLLVIVPPFAPDYKYLGRRIAGRYYYEAILILRPGDTLTLCYDGKEENFVATKVDKEIFLIRKTR